MLETSTIVYAKLLNDNSLRAIKSFLTEIYLLDKEIKNCYEITGCYDVPCFDINNEEMYMTPIKVVNPKHQLSVEQLARFPVKKKMATLEDIEISPGEAIHVNLNQYTRISIYNYFINRIYVSIDAPDYYDVWDNEDNAKWLNKVEPLLNRIIDNEMVDHVLLKRKYKGKTTSLYLWLKVWLEFNKYIALNPPKEAFDCTINDLYPYLDSILTNAFGKIIIISLDEQIEFVKKADEIIIEYFGKQKFISLLENLRINPNEYFKPVTPISAA